MATRRAVPVAVALVLAAGCMGGGTSPPPPRAVEPGGRQVDPGLAAAVDAYFADDLTGAYENRRSLVVTVRGRTVLERYDAGSTPATSYNVQSVGKSILCTLVGIAVGAGRLRLDGTLAELLPAYRSAMSPGMAAVTLRQLVTMTAGLPAEYYASVFGPDVPRDVDWVRTILAAGQEGPPGRFRYSDGGMHLVAAILRRAVGPLLPYARRTLLDPLGIRTTPAVEGVARPENVALYDAAGFAWPTDPQGVSIGGGGQKLTAGDLARLGALWLAGGRWQGRQLVPAGWLAAATTQRVPAQDPYGYGYGFWTFTTGGHRAFAALGLGGQVVEVVPDLDLVAVVQSTSRTDPTAGFDQGVAGEDRYVEIIGELIVPRIR